MELDLNMEVPTCILKDQEKIPKLKNTRKKLVTEAHNYIFKDSKEHQITKCKLLGKKYECCLSFRY